MSTFDGYEVKELRCEIHTGGGDVDQVWPRDVSPQTLLELLAVAFPTILDMIDSVTEIRLTLVIREK